MATTGQINTNKVFDSYFWVYWSQEGEQDIANNKTKIYWSCGVTCGHNFYSNAIKMSAVTINGVKVYKGGTYSNFYKGENRIAKGYLDITHDADGTKSFKIDAFTGWLYSNNNYSSNGGSFSLTKIPRQATITAAPDFTDLDNPTITYSNPAGSSVAALEACISLTGASADIGYRAVSKTGNSYTFELTDAERTVLRENTTGSPPTRTVKFCLRTTIGSQTFLSNLQKNFTVQDTEATRPAVSMITTLDNGSIPSAFDGLYIQGKSKVNVNLSAEGKYNATIQSYGATIDGKTYNSKEFTSDIIHKSGIVEIVGSATDSRGITGYVSEEINVIEYAKPMVIPLGSENSILCYRSDGNGIRSGNSTSIWIKAKRFYYNVAGKNTCALQWRWKPIAEAWNDSTHLWKDLVLASDTTTDEYNALIPDVVFDKKTAYSVQIRAVDTLQEHDIKTFEIPTQDVALHLGKGGKNVSVGTYCDYSEEHTFYSEWKGIFDKDVVIKGDVLLGETKTTLKDYILSVINEGG